MPLRPFSALGLVLLSLLAVSIRLGLWQVERMQEKQSLLERFNRPEDLDLQAAIDSERQYAHVRVKGRYDTGWHLLLDNKILKGRAGVHALTLFLPDEGLPILVNRGWLPLSPDRSRLPEVPTPSGRLEISGRLDRPDAGGIKLGDPDDLRALAGARLITYLDMNELASASGRELSSWLIRLDQDDSSGFGGRDWKPTVMMPEQHRAYAVQWFALALVLAVVWFGSIWKWRHGPEGANDNGAVGSP